MTGIKKIGVCGAGAMGSSIAQIAAQSGHQVVVFDVSAPARAKSQALISKGLDQLVSRGKLDPEKAAAVLSAMSWTDDLPHLADCDLVIEAIIEDPAVKQGLFAKIEEQVGPSSIIASNTSSLSIARLGQALQRPQRFIGMHFFNPATVMKLVEVVSGPATDPLVAEQIAALARTWGKVAVHVADVPGFIVNRVARPFYAEAFRALQEKAAQPEVIDHLFKQAGGFRMGPLELTDLIGQDVNFAVARSVYDAYFGQTRFVPQLTQSALVDANWLGRKSGRGIYVYEDGKGPEAPQIALPSPLDNAPPKPDLVRPDLEGFCIGGVHIRFSRGQTACAEAAGLGRPVAVLDWFDANGASAAGFSASSEEAAEIAVRLLAAWGLRPSRLKDRPGLILLRTLAQIANSAGDLVFEGVSDEVGTDDAMRFGANYPFGPLEWAQKLGAAPLVETLAAIARETGQMMYSPSEYWMSKL